MFKLSDLNSKKLESIQKQNFHFSLLTHGQLAHCLWQPCQSFAFLFISLPNRPRWLLSHAAHEGPVPFVSFLWPNRATTLHLWPRHCSALLSARLPHPLCSHKMMPPTYHLSDSPISPPQCFSFEPKRWTSMAAGWATTDQSPPATSGPTNKTECFPMPQSPIPVVTSASPRPRCCCIEIVPSPLVIPVARSTPPLCRHLGCVVRTHRTPCSFSVISGELPLTGVAKWHSSGEPLDHRRPRATVD
jgi:hypothetical protein